MYLKIKRSGERFWTLLNRFIVGSVTGYCVSETILCLPYDSINNKLMLRTKVLLWDKEKIYMNEGIKVLGCFSSELRNHSEFIISFFPSPIKGPEVMILQESWAQPAT